ncbi:MAG: ATPase [Acidobacteria bacterium]|nr:MAG: ATPase [Acidobacteriota bacterium]
MTVTDTDRTVDAVRKTITVQTSPQRAFHVFTAEYDSWWPRSHHIGKSPMKRAIIEGRAGGRCYTEQEDGTDCDWGSVLVWDPPHRLVIAWQIDGKWQFEPDDAAAIRTAIDSPNGWGGLLQMFVDRVEGR